MELKLDMPPGVSGNSADVNRVRACQLIDKYMKKYEHAIFGPCKSMGSGLNLETEHLIGWVLPYLDAAIGHLIRIEEILRYVVNKIDKVKEAVNSADLSRDDFELIKKWLTDFLEDCPCGDFGFWLCDAARGEWYLVDELLEKDIIPQRKEYEDGRKLVYDVLKLDERGRCYP